MEEKLYLYCIEYEEIKIYELPIRKKYMSSDGECISYYNGDGYPTSIQLSSLDKVSGGVMYSLKNNEETLNDYKTKAIQENERKIEHYQSFIDFARKMNKVLRGE